MMYYAGYGAGYVGLVFSIVFILTCLLSFKYYLTYSSNTLIRFRSSTRFYLLSFVATAICYIVIFIIFLAQNVFAEHVFFFGFAILAWIVFHYLLFSLVNSFIRNLEGKSGVAVVDRDFREI